MSDVAEATAEPGPAAKPAPADATAHPSTGRPRVTSTPPGIGAAVRRRIPLTRIPLTRGPGLLALVAGIAVIALGVGLILGRAVLPSSAAEPPPPEAGSITAPLETRVISSTITARADVTYADAVDLDIDVSALSGPPIVTGRVPEVGAVVDAAQVIIEVAGRPVLALPGELPAYRSLRAGYSGPDVLQLKAALVSLGIDPGDAANDVYDARTAAAVDELYRRSGYPSPESSPDARRAVEAAERAVSDAAAQIAAARSALEAAGSGASAAERLAADNAVRQAQRELDAAVAAGEPQAQRDTLADAVELAKARRTELDLAPDVSDQQATLDSALAAENQAVVELTRARDDALTPLPASEVRYLTSLPRRVDAVSAKRGGALTADAVSLSGAAILLDGTVSPSDAEHLAVGQPATFVTDDGRELQAVIREVGEEADGDEERRRILLDPVGVDQVTMDALRGKNVRVTVPIESTDGEVLAAPVAALTAGPTGESRVTVADEESGEESTLTVTTGLSAGGFVEIRGDDPRLKAGTRVVVGR